MAEDEENKIIAALSVHNLDVSRQMSRIMGGIWTGAAMGSLILALVAYQFIKVETKVERNNELIIENTKDIAVIKSEIKRVNYKEK